MPLLRLSKNRFAGFSRQLDSGLRAGATALLGRAASAAYGAGARSSGDQSLSNKMGPPQNSFCGE